jgi:hypothetical protein
MNALRWIIAVLSLIAASAAIGQVRAIPQNATRGIMSPASGMNVVLDGNPVGLAAGAIIRGQNNLIVVPSALPPSSDVRYIRDGDGRISRVWVLTDAEKQNAPGQSSGSPFYTR